jgi:Insertion element 4 transposase N-terminal/Transposase DDE domain
MARYAKQLSRGEAATDHLSAGILAHCFPMSAVREVLASSDHKQKRIRDLPVTVTVYFVIALSLFPGVAYQEVLRWLLAGLRFFGGTPLRASVKSALGKARQRLGVNAMRSIHEVLARPLNDPKLAGGHWKGLLLVAIDGTTLALQDTPENAQRFGRPSNQGGDGPWPMARIVALAEVGTHLIFKAAFGGYHDSEVALARGVLKELNTHMLCLADRLFPGFALWKEAAASGCALLWRAKVGLDLKCVRVLADGSWLAHWHPSEKERRKSRVGLEPILVRVIEYRLKGEAKGQTYRLITTLLDPAFASAGELAALYPERWEIELCVKETKTVLRNGTVTLRSKLPEMVEQEFWGLLLAHYAVRKTMALAALRHDLDPDRISHASSVEIIKMTQAGSALPSPPTATTKSH